MIFFLLYFEFLKVGLFAIGGGLATIPFLFDLSASQGWYSVPDLVNMIALSESTPGPLGINMATFAGVKTAGIAGGLIATLGLVTPALFIIIAISYFLKKFKTSATVQSIFYGLRPAVSMMILTFVIEMIRIIIDLTPDLNHLLISGVLFVCYLVLILRYKFHPIFFILLAAVMGILLEL